MNTLCKVLIALLVTFAVAMLGLNLKLSTRNRQIQAQIRAEFQRQELANTPVRGWTMPPLKGHDGKGLPLQVDLQGKDRVLLLFSASCGVCDENWPNWQRLLADPSLSSQLVPISFDKSVADEYLKKHQISDREVLVGLDPDIVKSMRLGMTPQTIVVRQGKVEHSWVGRLSRSDLREIKGLLNRESASKM